MPGRRPRLLGSTIERLEARGLLSVVGSTRVAHLDLSDGLRGAADVAATDARRSRGRSIAGESGLDESARTPHAVAGSVVAPSTARLNAGGGGGAKRSGLQAVTTRELPDPVQETPHRPDSPTVDEPTLVESEIAGLGGEDNYELAVSNSLVGWAPGGAASVSMSVAYSPNRGAGLDGRAKPGAGSPAADASTPGSFGDVIPGLGLWSGDGRIRPGPAGHELRELAIVAATADHEARSPAWAELLEGALSPDWESIDREMRRFLAGIGGLADASEVREAGQSWLLWIGAAAALFLAHRARYSPRRLFRRAGPGAIRVGAHHPLPVGPWPLGSP